MLYKEWLTVRTKFLLWLIVYAGAMALFLYGRANHSYTEPLFQSWLGIACLVMAVISALGGVDIIAEEKSSGTLSFVMTRPISRTRIYTSKIGVNVAALAAASIPANLIMLALDQFIPTPVTWYETINVPCGEATMNCGFYGGFELTTLYQSTNALQSLAAIAVILMFGIGVICLSGFISIFATNTIRAIFFTIPALVLSVVFIGFLVTSINSYYDYYPRWFSGADGVPGLIIFTIAGGFFYAGLITFKRKEF
jgi:ABC-type transport system involved in multi-copper enzyme maturation permease subunit